MNYLDKLRQSAKITGSIACMGLDPVISAMPLKHGNVRKIPFFIKDLFEEMARQGEYPGLAKPNQGFYVRHNITEDKNSESFEGDKALARVVRTWKNMFEEIPICLDYKRGDIAKSSENYAAEGFEAWNADSVTVAPYMGYDSVLPFAGRNPKDLEQAARYCNDEDGKGVYVLCRTSNDGAKDFQDLMVISDLEKFCDELGEKRAGCIVYASEERGLMGKLVKESSCIIPLYMAVVHKIIDWARDNPGIGAVVGANYLKELDEIARLIVSSGVDVPLLIPGAGKKSEGGQGGDASEVVAVLREAGYPLELARINSSSGITHPWAKGGGKAPDDYAKVSVEKLAKLNELINYKPAA
ncbi:orotidine 5'-phosphate decarboxylase [Candidatus Woesearchaeota archaeon]|nr:orotidine 5'-phosphate decarboxylase [Candidatus Woesearchaeota archaeon]